MKGSVERRAAKMDAVEALGFTVLGELVTVSTLQKCVKDSEHGASAEFVMPTSKCNE